MSRLPGGMASPFVNCFSLLSQTGSIPSEGTKEGGRLTAFLYLLSVEIILIGSGPYELGPSVPGRQ